MEKIVYLMLAILLAPWPTYGQKEHTIFSFEFTHDIDTSFDVMIYRAFDLATTLEGSLIEITECQEQDKNHLLATNTKDTNAVPAYLTSVYFFDEGKDVFLEDALNRLETLIALNHTEFTKQHSTQTPLKSVPLPSRFMAENTNLNLDEGFGPRFGL